MPSPIFLLPDPIAAYVEATNRGDLETLLDQFADDALVNDQLRDHWGRDAIRAWAARDIVGECLTMTVIGVVLHHGHVIVTAAVDGAFDKRGLPEPLVYCFYFAHEASRIVQLFILPSQVAA